MASNHGSFDLANELFSVGYLQVGGVEGRYVRFVCAKSALL